MELMELLYRIMEEISKEGNPVVFKGAMVLNLLIQENNPAHVERSTRDIDGDWVGKAPSMSEMEAALRKAVKRVDESLDVVISREYAEKRSAGFKIICEGRGKISSIDLSVRENSYVTRYNMRGIKITGSSLNKMLSDKLYATSDRNICRRVKDIVDLYIMSYITEVNIEDIYKIWDQTNRVPGNFTEFRNRREEIQQAYEKMKGIKNKPDFSDLYSRLNLFLYPFFYPDHKHSVIWTGESWKASNDNRVRESVIKRIANSKQKSCSENNKEHKTRPKERD